MESRVVFDTQLLCQGVNLNKFVVYFSLLVFITLLPMHLDEAYYLGANRSQYLEERAREYFIDKSNRQWRQIQNDAEILSRKRQALKDAGAEGVEGSELADLRARLKEKLAPKSVREGVFAG